MATTRREAKDGLTCCNGETEKYGWGLVGLATLGSWNYFRTYGVSTPYSVLGTREERRPLAKKRPARRVA